MADAGPPAPSAPDRTADRRLLELTTLNAVLDLLNRPQRAGGDPEAPLTAALSRLVDLVGARAGWLFVSTAEGGDAHRGGFRLAARCGLPPALSSEDDAPLRRGGCECQTLFRRGRLERGINLVECSRLESATGDREGLELHASVPLLAPRGPVGILNLATPGSARFDDETLALLAAVGKALGNALERQRLERRRERDARRTATLEERQRLAQEMHDALSQQLFAAQLALETGRAQEGSGADGALARAAASIEAAQRDVRALVATLRPAELDCGLGDALARLAERAAGRTAVHLDLDAPDPPGALADAAYRIAQEALGNSLRHGNAGNAWLRWRRAEAGALELTVDDDGAGLPAEMHEGLGIPGMRRRAERAGGRLELGVAPAGGARVRARFELPASTGDGGAGGEGATEA